MPRRGPGLVDHIWAIVILPFSVTILIPAVILYTLSTKDFIDLNRIPYEWAIGFGVFFIGLGLVLFIESLKLFVKIGKGTLAPWHPTKNIVVTGLYRHVRNPMLIGINIVLLGEAFLFRSGNILVFMLFFVGLNHLYFVLKEEPDLVKRFGSEYIEYCKHVPRWIPRLKGWRPEGNIKV